MDKNLKPLTSFFLVIIAIIAFLWYRSENAASKQIEKLNDKITAYEETIEGLKKENKSMEEELATYYGDD
jgi:cell division protein FtsB